MAEGRMNLKLEELRKRLLDSMPGADAPAETVYKRSTEGAISSEPVSATAALGSATAQPATREAQGATQPVSVAGGVLQYVTGEDKEKAGAKSRYHVAHAVAKVFESTRIHQERLAELSKSFDSIEQMAQAAARAFEPIRAFHAQMEKLSGTFEPMRSFQEQLGAMAATFEPMKALHEQMVQMAEAFQFNLAQFATSLEPARKFQAQLEKLAKVFESVGELQEQFVELSEAFRSAARGGGEGVAAHN